MSFENLAGQIVNEWVTDLKTHRHLRNGWDQIDQADADYRTLARPDRGDDGPG
jgi:hypothetical protein